MNDQVKNNEKPHLKQDVVDVNDVNEYGETALGNAAYCGDVDLITLLLQHGADPKVKDEGSILANIIFAESLDALKLLVEYGADVNARGSHGQTPLMIAAYRGNVDIVSYLLDRGADASLRDEGNQSALWHAIANGNAEVIDRLLALEDSTSSESSIFLHDQWKRNLLMYALLHGTCAFDSIKKLLTYGFDMNAQDEDGVTALLYTMQEARKNFPTHELIKLLLEKGANVDMQSGKGETALIIAARYGDTDIVKLLLEHGANHEIRDLQGATALHCAAYSFKPLETVQVLLKYNADVHAVDNEGRTVLMCAIWGGSSELVSTLLSDGVDVQAQASQTSGGKTALLDAINVNSLEIASLLLDQGADMHVRDAQGQTVFTLAARHGNVQMMELLFEHAKKSTVE